MGCENSKTVRVLPSGNVGREEATQTSVAKHKEHIGETFITNNDDKVEYELDEHGNKIKRDRRQSQSPAGDNKDTSSNDSSLAAERALSATSKQSTDSGLGEENSRSKGDSEIHDAEKVFKRRDNLQTGKKGLQEGLSGSRTKECPRVKESQIMQRLQDEGLISRPQVQATGGMRFDIMAAATAPGGVAGVGEAGTMPKPPPRLEKLALERRQKKKKKVLTEDDIREKLEIAERRRKRREEERLAKLKERERPTDAVAALESFMQYQKNKEETISQRMDQVQDNRERKLQELREKQERRKRHAEEVRKRKALVAQNGTNEHCQQDESVTLKMTPRPEMTTNPEGITPSGLLQVEGCAENIRNSIRVSVKSAE